MNPDTTVCDLYDCGEVTWLSGVCLLIYTNRESKTICPHIFQVRWEDYYQLFILITQLLHDIH